MKRGFVIGGISITVFIICLILLSVFTPIMSADPVGAPSKSKIKDTGPQKNSTIPMPFATSCSQLWGGNCSEGPPETFKNTYDNCSTGAGGDESINEMWLNQTETSFGQSIGVTCNVMIWGVMAAALNDSSMNGTGCGWGWNGDGLNIYYNSNLFSSGTGPSQKTWTLLASYPQVFSCENYSVIFPVASVLGTHVVRCVIGYKLNQNDYCGGSGASAGYFDNDDMNLTVYSEPQYISITISGGTPIDFGSSNVSNPQSNQPATNNPLIVTIDSNFNFTITTQADSPNFVSGSGDSFPIGNMQWNSTSNPTLTPYTTNAAVVYDNQFVNKTPTAFPIYHYLTVPSRQMAGTYSAGIIITAKRTGT